MSTSLKKFRKVPYIVSVVFFVFSCAIFFLLFDEIKENKRISEENQIKWQTEATRREEIRSLGRSLKDIAEERVLLESHFAYSSDVVPFLDTIELLAERVNVKPEITSVDILKNDQVLSVVLKASGSFGSIYKYLTLLENSPYEIQFATANLQIRSGQEKLYSPQWEATFKIQLLSFIQ